MKYKNYDNESIELLIEKFNSQTLEKPDWTHEAHLVAAIWFLSEYNYFEAVCRLKAGIIMLNNSHHNYNTSSTGYHETITIFWTKIISLYIKLAKLSVLEDLVNNFLHSPLSNHHLPFEFYNKERLMTADLRSIYAKEEIKLIDEHVLKMLLTER